MADYTFNALWDDADDWSDFTVVGDSYMTAARKERPALPWRAGAGHLSTAAGVNTATPYVEAVPTSGAMKRRFARWAVAMRVQSLVVTASHVGPFQITGKKKDGTDLGVVVNTNVDVGQTGQDSSSIFLGDFSAKVVDPPDEGPGVEVSGFANTWMIWDWALHSEGETEGSFTAQAYANIYIERLGAIQPAGLFKYTGDLSAVYEWTGFRIGLDSMDRATESFIFWVDEWRVAFDDTFLPIGKLPISRSCPLKTIR